MEFPQLGTNCVQLDCEQLDFLPFICQLCEQTFCLQHRLPTDHKCELWEQANKNLQKCPTCNSFVFIPKHLGKETISTQETLELHLASACQNYVFSPSAKIEPVQCHLAGCGDVEKYVGGVKCEGCKEKFCLKHRSPLVHACSSLDALEVQKQRKRQAAQELLAQTFFKKTAADGTSAADLAKKAKAASTPRPVKGSRTVEVIKMKASARGDASIPQASRLYLHVRFPVEAGLPNKSMFMDKNWTVGRALDKIADTGKILNVNNRVVEDDGERLHLYKLSDTTGDVEQIANGQRLDAVLESADEVMLERWKVWGDKCSGLRS